MNGALPGWVIEHHDEAFARWRVAIGTGLLVPPFHVTHVDAHADLFELYRVTNRPAEAEQHLIAAVRGTGDKQSRLRLRLAGWYQSQGKKEAAMRQAQLAMTKDPRWSSPYYWAAFVLVGDKD